MDISEFWKRISIKPNGCWEWIGVKNNKGYGLVTTGSGANRSTTTAHRFIFKLKFGVHLGRLDYVCHKCDNPSCVRPSHLFLGSPRANMLDMQRKGRRNWRGNGRV